jgi:hypothetical protein
VRDLVARYFVSASHSAKKEPRPHATEVHDFRAICSLQLALAAAYCRVVDRDGAFATAFDAATKTTAHGLDHFLAASVFRGAVEADAVGEHFAAAIAAGEAALAANFAIFRAAETQIAAIERAAGVLQLGAGGVVVALAVDHAAAFALFDLDFAADRCAHLAGWRSTSGLRSAGAILGLGGRTIAFLHYGIGHLRSPFCGKRSVDVPRGSLARTKYWLSLPASGRGNRYRGGTHNRSLLFAQKSGWGYADCADRAGIP